MSIIHVQQIKSHLEATFGPLVDCSDVANAPDHDRNKTFLTRALAAFAVRHLCDIEDHAAAGSITDGQGDNGIDAIHFDTTEKTFYVAQSKWHQGGHGSITSGDAKKFISGFKDLINARFDRFNAKVQEKRQTIQAALYDANTKFVLVVCYPGLEPLSEDVGRDFTDLLGSLNDPTNVVSLRVLRQVDLHNILSQGAKGAPINFDVVLYEWGQTAEPYRSYYGQVAATDLAEWYSNFHPRIFTPNIRMFLGLTGVNESIIATLKENPSNFWYFNNGITVLCASIRKKMQGGAGRETGIFECSDVSIVNGAQTVGSIANAAADMALERLGLARVPIRLISLENCPPELSTQITRATNTQNRIDSRDFVSLDGQQERLRNELMIDGVEYVYKSGDVVQNREKGFDLTEATVALACSQADKSLAVQAKREISKLWDDIAKPPYTRLFNGGLSGRTLWRLVQVQRQVDRKLGEIRQDADDRLSKVAVHGNRFIAAQVFAELSKEELGGEDVDIEAVFSNVADLTAESATSVREVADKLFPDAYLQSLFKNANKCGDIDRELRGELKAGS